MIQPSSPSRFAAAVALLAAAGSCTQARSPSLAATMEVGAPASTDRAIADAAPLLDRLDLAVGAADAAPVSRRAIAGTSFVSAAQTPEDVARATRCLADAVYYEARSEPEAGQRAVAQVVLNRVRDRAFPASVCGVVYQGSERSTGCQFTFTCDGSLLRGREPGGWARAWGIAADALGGRAPDLVGSATHYHADSILPWWAPSLRRIGALGHHVFYRWAAPLERALAFRQRYAGIEPGEPAALAAAAPLPDDMAEVNVARSENGVTVHRAAWSGPAATVEAGTPTIVNGVRVHGAAAALASDPAPGDGTTIRGVRVHYRTAQVTEAPPEA